MRIIARLLYWPALLTMIPSLIISLSYSDTASFISLIIGAMSSSLILYCKTYDWLIALAFKRKHLDKIYGIHTGWYFVFVMSVSIVTFLCSYIGLLFYGGDSWWLATVCTTALCLVCVFINNLRDAYKANPDEVLDALNRY